MRRSFLLPLVVLGTLLVPACAPTSGGGGAAPATSSTPDLSILGPNRLGAADLATWFRSVKGDQHRLPISIDELAQLFIDEGNDEGIRGDVAFAQSILETGWFWFPDSGQVRPWYNNYAGIGAVDGGSTPNQFASPREGVRAQIQHLRAYGDATVTASKLAHPLVDPRFNVVSPKGKAPTWGSLSGTWASSTTYGQRILDLYAAATRYAGKALFPARAVAAHPGGGHYVLYGNGLVESRGGAPDFGHPSFAFDIARDIEVMPGGDGYIVLDGFGGLWRYGSAAVGPMGAIQPWYVHGFDIANALAITADGAGVIVLDGWGGTHPRGTAPHVVGPYWKGWDIARDVELDGAGGVYILDGWGVVHQRNGAPSLGSTYWKGWDIARDLVVMPDGTGYAVFDGWGAVHRFGTAPGSPASWWQPSDRWVGASRTVTGYAAVQRGGASATS